MNIRELLRPFYNSDKPITFLNYTNIYKILSKGIIFIIKQKLVDIYLTENFALLTL